MKAQLERIAVVLTPLVFAPLASFVAAFVATNFPGLPHVTPAEITGVEVTAFVTTGGLVYKWLHGRQLMMKLHAINPAIVNTLHDVGLTEGQVVDLMEQRVWPLVEKELLKRFSLAASSPTPAA